MAPSLDISQEARGILANDVAHTSPGIKQLGPQILPLDDTIRYLQARPDEPEQIGLLKAGPGTPGKHRFTTLPLLDSPPSDDIFLPENPYLTREFDPENYRPRFSDEAATALGRLSHSVFLGNLMSDPLYQETHDLPLNRRPTDDLLKGLNDAQENNDPTGVLDHSLALYARADSQTLMAEEARIEDELKTDQASNHVVARLQLEAIKEELRKKGNNYRAPLLIEHIKWRGQEKTTKEPKTIPLSPLTLRALELMVGQNNSGKHELDDNDKVHDLYGIIRAMDGNPGSLEIERRKGYKPPFKKPKNPEDHFLQGTHLMDMFSASSEAARTAGTVLTPEALRFIKMLYATKDSTDISSRVLKLRKMSAWGALPDISRTLVPARWEVGENGHARPVEWEIDKYGKTRPADKVSFVDFLIKQFGAEDLVTSETFIQPWLHTKTALFAGSLAFGAQVKRRLSRS